MGGWGSSSASVRAAGWSLVTERLEIGIGRPWLPFLSECFIDFWTALVKHAVVQPLAADFLEVERGGDELRGLGNGGCGVELPSWIGADRGATAVGCIRRDDVGASDETRGLNDVWLDHARS